MLRRDGPAYTLIFAAAVCAVCAVLVSVSAVTLKERQEANTRLDIQLNVLSVAGLIPADARPDASEIARLYKARVSPEVIDLKTGRSLPRIDPGSFDQRLASTDPNRSKPAPPNPAKVARVPNNALVFKIRQVPRIEMVVLPVEGKGLWSTLYGFLALDAHDLNTIRGIAFYKHGETPGLGGEVDNPKWRGLWRGRKAFDAARKPVITVIKGPAGPVRDDPHHVDGLSGATMTSNGVTALVQFWLSDDGYGPYLKRFSDRGGR